MTFISNCSGSIICDIFRYARIEPQVLQVEIHPYNTQEALLKFAKTLGIAVTAYSSFGPQSYFELGMADGVKALFQNDVVTQAAQKAGKSMLDCLSHGRIGFLMVNTSMQLPLKYFFVGLHNKAWQ